MAAVAPAHLEAHTVNLEYGIVGNVMDADVEEDSRITLPNNKNPPTSGIRYEADSSTGEAGSASEDAADALDDEQEEEEGNVHADPVKLSKGRVESDDEVVEDDILDTESSSVDGDDSAKSSSDAESAVVEEWEGGSEGPEDASVEVANRNNCMSVFLSWFLIPHLIYLQFLWTR